MAGIQTNSYAYDLTKDWVYNAHGNPALTKIKIGSTTYNLVDLASAAMLPVPLYTNTDGTSSSITFDSVKNATPFSTSLYGVIYHMWFSSDLANDARNPMAHASVALPNLTTTTYKYLTLCQSFIAINSTTDSDMIFQTNYETVQVSNTGIIRGSNITAQNVTGGFAGYQNIKNKQITWQGYRTILRIFYVTANFIYHG